jgi:multidrug efflux system outer membrane protein
MRARLLITTLLLPALIAGCAQVVHTDPPSLGEENQEGAASVIGDVSQQVWWSDLNDKTLDAMIARSLDENLTVQTALTRVAQAQSALDGTGLASSMSGNASLQSRRAGGDGTATTNTRSASFGPSLMVDLFGGQKEARARAMAQLEGSELDVGTARLSVISGVVDTYIQARYLQQAIEVTTSAVEKRRETTELTQEETRLGAGTELSAAQARVTLESAEKNLADLRTSYRNTGFALATLLAQPADEVMSQLKAARKIPVPGKSAANVPADLLRNRPDVKSAEQALLAAAASVGIAKAQLYPSLSLSGNISANAGVTGWSFGPSLSIPVLNQPALRAGVRGSEAAMEQAHIAWKAAVLKAVEEAGVAANNVSGTQRALETSKKVHEAQKKVVELTDFSHEMGHNTMLDVLEARQALDDAELGVLMAERDEVQAWSALQIAAGRGWATQ